VGAAIQAAGELELLGRHWRGPTGAAPPGSPGSVPAIYDNGESVQHTDIVFWYIAHVSSLDRVTACGPWFALEGFPEPEEPDGHDHDH
jgi:hypothetical protein